MPAEIGKDYELFRGGHIVGHLAVVDDNFPCNLCEFTPAHGFDAVQAAFADFLEAGVYVATQEQRWEEARQRALRLGVVLQPASVHEPVVFPDILIYIDGNKARYRPHDKPTVTFKPKSLPYLLVPLWRWWSLIWWKRRLRRERRK